MDNNTPFLSPQYWDERYRAGNTGWDIQQVSPPLKRYVDELPDKQRRILIPGAGRAYEAIYLHRQSFGEVFVCDWAESAFETLRREAPDFPAEHLLVGDFFALDLAVDLMLEQTFFCAIDPELRAGYARKAAELLVPGGRLAGLLFASHFPFAGPPFGGTRDEYIDCFAPYFDILHLDIAPDSIAPRQGNELFFEFCRH